MMRAFCGVFIWIWPGTLPSPRQVTEFLADSNPHKREALIDQLLESPEFVDMWVTKLGDVFRARANG